GLSMSQKVVDCGHSESAKPFHQTRSFVVISTQISQYHPARTDQKMDCERIAFDEPISNSCIHQSYQCSFPVFVNYEAGCSRVQTFCAWVTEFFSPVVFGFLFPHSLWSLWRWRYQ